MTLDAFVAETHARATRCAWRVCAGVGGGAAAARRGAGVCKRRRTLIKNGTMSEAGVVSATVMNFAFVPKAGKRSVPWSADSPFLRAKTTCA